MSVPTDDFVKADFVDGKITLPHAGAFWRYLGFKVRDCPYRDGHTDRPQNSEIKGRKQNENNFRQKKLFTFIYTVVSS